MTSKHFDAAGGASLQQLLSSGKEALEHGSAGDAIRFFEAAEASAALDVAVQRELEGAYRAAGRELDAAAAHIAANAFETDNPLLLYNLATGYFQHGHPAAEKWYRITLQMRQNMAAAHQNLAALLRNRGQWLEADQHVELAYRDQWFFGEYADRPLARILLACTGGLGNVPTDALLPGSRYTLIKCMVDYQNGRGGALPECDVMFNAVGDPDASSATSPALSRFLESRNLPILNHPARVLATRRDRLFDTLASLEYVRVPQVTRVDAMAHQSEVVGLFLPMILAGPVIVRCAESHGGDSVALVDNVAALEAWLTDIRSSRSPRSLYATQFVDSRGSDGQFRKYRVIFIGGMPMPYHLAISSDWMVHYFSAGMTEAPLKLAEERQFLEDPAGSLGSAPWSALSAIGARLGLDYCGIDFTIDDGRILVFEANATMIIHHEREDGPLAHKNRHVDAIVAAFEKLVLDASAGASSQAT